MELQPMESDSSDGIRRRVVAGVIAAMLVAGAGGVGYGLGRSVDDGATSAAPATTSTPTSEVRADSTDEIPSATEEPVVEEPVVDTTGSTLSVAADSATSISATSGGVGPGGLGSGGFGWSMYGAEPLPTLFERTTEGGLTVRAHQGQQWEQPPVEPPVGVGDWTPAPWCFESGQLRIALAGDGIIDVAGVGWWREPFKGRAVSWIPMGGVDGRPQWVVVVQAPADTTAVSVAFAGGSADRAEPQNGVAVLVVPAGESDPALPADGYVVPEFTVAFEGGAEPVVLSAADVNNWDDPEFQDSCSPPPPALPEPGEQPADPVAAQAEIVDVMTLVYDATEREEGVVTDTTGIAEAREQVAAGGFAGEADSARATIEELVFTSPTEAWFRYRIDTSGAGLSDRYGIAQFVDGSWKITRDTVCQDLSMAGGDCGGGWQPVVPPSAPIVGD
jgi:hypothetical protein